MSYYLRSIQDEYDDEGNYIGNSEEGNRFHSPDPSPGKASAKLAGVNFGALPIEIEHKSLDKDHPDKFIAACPTCKRGTLLGQRHTETFELLSEDRCVLCGQAFIYTDLGEEV